MSDCKHEYISLFDINQLSVIQLFEGRITKCICTKCSEIIESFSWHNGNEIVTYKYDDVFYKWLKDQK